MRPGGTSAPRCGAAGCDRQAWRGGLLSPTPLGRSASVALSSARHKRTGFRSELASRGSSPTSLALLGCRASADAWPSLVARPGEGPVDHVSECSQDEHVARPVVAPTWKASLEVRPLNKSHCARPANCTPIGAARDAPSQLAHVTPAEWRKFVSCCPLLTMALRP